MSWADCHKLGGQKVHATKLTTEEVLALLESETLRTLLKPRIEPGTEPGGAGRRLTGPTASVDSTVFPNRLLSRLRENVLGLRPPILGLGLEVQRCLLSLSRQLPGHLVLCSPPATSFFSHEHWEEIMAEKKCMSCFKKWWSSKI